MSQKKIHKSVRAMTEGAILIAAAEVLSFLPLYKLPWGGSIDFAMLPVLLFCCRWGFGPGMLVSCAHAILQTLFEGGIAPDVTGEALEAYKKAFTEAFDFYSVEFIITRNI